MRHRSWNEHRVVPLFDCNTGHFEDQKKAEKGNGVRLYEFLRGFRAERIFRIFVIRLATLLFKLRDMQTIQYV